MREPERTGPDTRRSQISRLQRNLLLLALGWAVLGAVLLVTGEARGAVVALPLVMCLVAAQVVRRRASSPSQTEGSS